jgi:glycine reductase
VIVKEIERAGITTAHICSVTSIAMMVGSNRVIPGVGIVYPLGNPELNQEAEKVLRRTVVERALNALQTDVTEQKLFLF